MTGEKTSRLAVKVEIARPADADVLAALETEAFGDDAWAPGAIAGGFEQKGVTTLLARGGNRGDGLCGKAAPAIGFAIWRLAADEAEILSLGVAPKDRGKGVAATLLKAVVDGARSAGARILFLDVAADNAAARRLYERAGFRPVGRRRGYYRNGANALVMRLTLCG